MQALADRIRNEGRNLGSGILKVDGFLNHQLEPAFMLELGRAFTERFEHLGVTGVTKVITAEVSGISPAFATAAALDVPLIYARKTRPVTMTQGVYEAEAPSRTKGGTTRLVISPEYLLPSDRVLIIDDFLASGKTLVALASLIRQCGATLLGLGCVIEKAFEGGRERLEPLSIPVVSLAIVERMEGDEITVRPGTPAHPT